MKRKNPNRKYQPNPINVSKIRLTPELSELLERLARNTHDVWAQLRLEQGWTYGPTRNDKEKKHPCLVPYEELPESEKDYDRGTSEGILKVIMSQGYTIHPPADVAQRKNREKGR